MTPSNLSRRQLGLAALGSFPLLAPAQTPVIWQEGQFETPDGRLAYAEAGRGPLLVVLPGGPGGSGWALRHWMAPLTEQLKVLVLDNIGRGRSSRLSDPRRYTLDRDAMDLEWLRQHLSLPRLSVYGQSYGGLVAQAWASSRPAQVQALVLGNTLHGATSWQEQIDACNRHVQRQHPEIWRQLMALRARGELSGGEAYQALYGPCVDKLYWFEPSRVAALKPPKSPQPDMDSLNDSVYLALLGPDPEWTVGGTLADTELLPQLRAVKAPALVLSGRADVIGAPYTAQQLADALPRAELRVFEASGHSPFVEEPRAWAETVRDFVRRASA
jgi:proline iminopeptidase